jgi:hypothetical protein
MEIENNQTTKGKLEPFLRVLPILGLLFYYTGGFIVGLEVAAMEVFVFQLVLFSLVLLVGVYLIHKYLVILGEVLVMLASSGPIMEFYTSLSSWTAATLGGALVLFAFVFHIAAIYAWLSEG